MTLDKGKVVYQIYPKSYKDTTGNGIGDPTWNYRKIPISQVKWIWSGQSILSKPLNGIMVTIFQDYMAVDPLFLVIWLLILRKWCVSVKSTRLTLCWTWYSIIVRQSMNGFRKP